MQARYHVVAFTPTSIGQDLFFEMPDWAPAADLYISTEASGGLGHGAYCQGEWFQGTWSSVQNSRSIVYKKQFPNVVACHVGGSR